MASSTSSTATQTECRVTKETITYPGLVTLAAHLKAGDCSFVCSEPDFKKVTDEVGISKIKLKYGVLEPLNCSFAMDDDGFETIPNEYDDVVYSCSFSSPEEKVAYEYVANRINADMKIILAKKYPVCEVSFKNDTKEIQFKQFKDFKKVDFDPQQYLDKPGKTCFRFSYIWVSQKGGNMSFGFKCQPNMKWLSTAEAAARAEELDSSKKTFKKRKVN